MAVKHDLLLLKKVSCDRSYKAGMSLVDLQDIHQYEYSLEIVFVTSTVAPEQLGQAICLYEDLGTRRGSSAALRSTSLKRPANNEDHTNLSL